MTTRRILIVLALIAACHNALRALASLFGASWGILNYLQPFHPKFSGPAMVTAAAVIAALLFIFKTAQRMWEKRTPEDSYSMMASALWTVPTATVVGLLAVMVSTSADRQYGVVLFVLAPFFTGFQATMAFARGRRITLSDALAVSTLSVGLLGLFLLAAAVEGVICLLMAAPLAVILAILGGAVGLLASRLNRADSSVTFLILASLAPFGGSIERALQPQASLFQVTTSIDLPASPERVWQTVLQPAQLSSPTNPLLRAGIGYPQASHIEGAGASAIRYCDFSTGKLVEPVLVWDEPRVLRFRVASSPIPMQEWTPYAQIHPPHLDGFLVSRRGEFRLIPLPAGGTRLEATTWYQHHLWPERYWRWWSDYIIHRIHEMVLANIRDRGALLLVSR